MPPLDKLESAIDAVTTLGRVIAELKAEMEREKMEPSNLKDTLTADAKRKMENYQGDLESLLGDIFS